MIRIIKNPSKLSREETRILQKKLEKIKEDIDYYSTELRILQKRGTQAQINRIANKLKMLYADLSNILELLEE